MQNVGGNYSNRGGKSHRGGRGGGRGNADGKGHDRGWEMGTVGWGVLGHFGSAEADNEAQVSARASSSGGGMVRNDKGLWVKAKKVTTADVEKAASKSVSGRFIRNEFGERVLLCEPSSNSSESSKRGTGNRDVTRKSRARSRDDNMPNRKDDRLKRTSTDHTDNRRRDDSGDERSSSRRRGRERSIDRGRDKISSSRGGGGERSIDRGRDRNEGGKSRSKSRSRSNRRNHSGRESERRSRSCNGGRKERRHRDRSSDKSRGRR